MSLRCIHVSEVVKLSPMETLHDIITNGNVTLLVCMRATWKVLRMNKHVEGPWYMFIKNECTVVEMHHCFQILIKLLIVQKKVQDFIICHHMISS